MEHGKQTDKSLDFPGTAAASKVRMKNNGYGTIFCHVLGHNTMRQFLFEQQICYVSKFVTYSSLKKGRAINSFQEFPEIIVNPFSLVITRYVWRN